MLSLLLYTGAVYGWAWFLTKSTLLTPARRHLYRLPFVGRMLRCIVCTSAWTGGAIALALPWVGLVDFELRGVADLLFVTGWNLGSVKVIAELVAWVSRADSGVVEATAEDHDEARPAPPQVVARG